jgi:cyanophycin synthetase
MMPLSRVVRRVAKELDRFNLAERRRHRQTALLAAEFLSSYWPEVAQCAGARYENLGDGFHRLSRGGSWTLAYKGDVMLDSNVALQMAGNKPLMYRLMEEWGLSCIPRYRLVDPDDVSAALKMLGEGMLVAKPAADTGGGRGVTTHIATAKQLRAAISIARRYASRVLIEEHVDANCFRLLYLNGEIIDAIWRKRPCVTGDGIKTIDALVDDENALRIQASGQRGISLIAKDAEYRNHLQHIGLSGSSVPAGGERLTVKNVVNQNSALENERVNDRVHPTIVAQCADICRHAKLVFAGVDLLIDDIARPWNSQRAIVNEVNTTPGLHHHVLVDSGSDNHRVGTRLLNHLLA